MNKKPFDIVSTVAIMLAAIAGMLYVGPWLLFDVLKIGNIGNSNQQLLEKTEIDTNEGLVLMEEKSISLSLEEEELYAVAFLDQQEESGYLVNEEVFRSLDWYRTLRKMAQIVKNQPITPDSVKVSRVIPAVDPNWDREGAWVMVPKIGLETQLQSLDQGMEAALEQGVVRIPDYGQPGDKDELPLILAAHRFGYQWWWKEPDYGRKHSFYYLPELVAGDLVQVVDEQGRKWYYEIYATVEGEKITDYEADLIMYTCKFLNSSQRYFQYARLIDPALYGNYPGTELGAGTEIEFVEEAEKEVVIQDREIVDEWGRTWIRQ